MRELHIIAACAERKRLPAPRTMSMRIVRGESLDTRFADWSKRMRDAELPMTTAEDLYVGEHWRAIRDLPEAAREYGFSANLLVASAGYGLVRSSGRLHTYAATFAREHADSILPRRAVKTSHWYRSWWNALGQERLAGRATTTLRAIAKAAPQTNILIVASPAYVSAMHDDILSALELMNGQLIIITSSAAGIPLLEPYVVNSTARLQASLGGSLRSLHARAAREILGAFDPKRARRHLARYENERPFIARQKSTDAQVRAFIKRSMARSYSTALRELRAAGSACEQSRFRDLFLEIKG